MTNRIKLNFFFFAVVFFSCNERTTDKSVKILTKIKHSKLNYIHNNPIKTGFVTYPVDWKYSSARNYIDNDKTDLEIDIN